MNFMATEYGILLPFFWLSFGTFGSLSEPCTQNLVVSPESQDVPIATIPCANSPTFTLTFYPAKEAKEEVITSPTISIINGYYQQKENDGKCSYISTHAALNSGGVYKCLVNSEPPTIAQFVVVDATAVCDVVKNTKVDPPCDQKLTCSLNYSANSTYVDVNMQWSLGDSAEALEGEIGKSTDDEGVTTAISTLDLAKFPKLEPNSDIYCRPKFSLTNLPTGFDDSNLLYYTGACQKPSSTHIACPPGTRPGDPTDETEKAKEGSVGGLSVGLFKRNVIILMVGIAAMLLIRTKGTSGV